MSWSQAGAKQMRADLRTMYTELGLKHWATLADESASRHNPVHKRPL